MDVFDGFAVARHFWPRLAAVLLLIALVFFPKPSYGLIEEAAKTRAQEFTSLLMDAVLPGEGRTAERRHGLTDARRSDRDQRARP
jgi:hypothetical protein